MLKLAARSLAQSLKNDRIQVETVGRDGRGGLGGKAFGNEGVGDRETEIFGRLFMWTSRSPRMMA